MRTIRGTLLGTRCVAGLALLSVLLLMAARTADGGKVVLYDNGPVVNSPGTGVDGADESVVQDKTLGMGVLGWACGPEAEGYRVADDFTVSAPNGWEITEITFFAYQLNSGTTSPITSIVTRIWDGSPDDPASSVVFGDTTTNRLLATTWVNSYRVYETTTGASDVRPIMVSTASAGVLLPPGDYWLDWQVGVPERRVYMPSITINGVVATGNALQYTGEWRPVYDTEVAAPQGLPFILLEGYCDAPSLEPVGTIKTVWTGASRTHARLSWPAITGATGYSTWWVTDEPGGIPDAREGGPWPSVSGCHQTPATNCVHADARNGFSGTVFFYQVRAVCDAEEAPE